MLQLLLRAVLGLAVVLAFVFSARAAQPFDAKAFQAAQAARKTILIGVSASWCSTCKRQRPILQNAEKERPGLVVFDVDFDSAKDVLRRFGVRHPSTLVVFNGTTEVGRSTGDTDPVSIRALIAKGF